MFILLKPKLVEITTLRLDANLHNKPTRDFLYFQYKQLISPYKYDLEKTPLIQIICERIGNLHTQEPIGFYNFVHERVIPNKIEFPMLSKASKIEISLKRRNSTIYF